MTNQYNSVFYTGVTENLIKRIWQHKNSVEPKSFTTRYKTYKLVFYIIFEDIEEAILKEKQIKGGSRKDKINLIKSMNLSFDDLYDNLI